MIIGRGYLKMIIGGVMKLLKLKSTPWEWPGGKGYTPSVPKYKILWGNG